MNRTINLEEIAEEFREEQADLREEYQSRLSDDPEFSESEAFEDMNERYVYVKEKANEFEDLREEFGAEPVFTIKGLTFAEVQRASDEMTAASFEIDAEQETVDGVPRNGFYEVKVLELGIVDAPVDSVHDLPYHTGEYLFDQIDELTTGNEVSGLEEVG